MDSELQPLDVPPKRWLRCLGLLVIGVCLLYDVDVVSSYGRALLLAGGDVKPKMDPSGRQTKQSLLRKFVELPKQISGRQEQAIFALHRMQQEDTLNTNFSTREHVLGRGFPREWNPCVLERRFRQKEGEPLRVVVTGGSPSSRPGSNCSTDGRYSALLQERFRIEEAVPKNISQWYDQRSMLQFQVINMAQGGATSITGSLLMDQYIDPNKTDVIVWEFLINDHSAAGGPEEQVRKLDFWLTRVHALFSQAGKLPPPIIINYLWGYNYGYWLRKGKLKQVDHNPLQYAGDLIDSYRDLGWDIAVLNVGAAVNLTPLLSHPELLFDDGSHPSCEGAHLIGDMLAHLFYTNLATSGGKCADVEIPVEERDDIDAKLHSMIPTHTQIWPNTTTPLENLWEDLFRNDAVVGSLTAWEPQLGNTSALRYNLQDVLDWKKKIQGKAAPDREDRKITYLVPPCRDRNGLPQQLNLTLMEPNLTWLGLTGDFDVYINKIKMPIRNIQGWCQCGHYMKQWIHVMEYVPKSEEYVVSMCHAKNAPAVLRYLVGVSLPNASIDNNTLGATSETSR